MFGLFVLFFFECDSSLDEVHEEWVRIKHGALVFRVILSTDKPTLFRDFDHFHKVSLRVFAHTLHAGLFEACTEVGVELKAVAVAFADESLAVSLGCL